MNVHAIKGERKKCCSQLSALEGCLAEGHIGGNVV